MIEGYRNGWSLCLLMLILYASCFCYLSEARRLHPQKSSAVVIGAVYCDTCFQGDVSNGKSHYISGATVAIECAEGRSRAAFQQEVKTDKQGKFKVKLPFSSHKPTTKIEGCTVKLVKSSEPHCATVASTATSSLVHLNQIKGGNNHIYYSAGYFSFKPHKKPSLCKNQQQQQQQQQQQLNSLQDLVNPTIPIIMPDPETPTTPNPTTPTAPSVPTPPYPTTPETPNKGGSGGQMDDNDLFKQPQQLFPPIIPPVFTPPPQGPIPLPPNPLQPPPLVPNPLQPPAPPLIPNPFQPPTPPPSLLPPLPPMPGLPTIPGLTPPPVPSPPPPSSLPLPPIIPMPPGLGGSPLIPGLPPLKAKKANHPHP